MKTMRWMKAVLVTLACGSWLVPAPPVWGANPVAGAATTPGAIVDVRLSDGGTLRGRLVAGDQRPVAQQPLLLVQSGTPVAAVCSDADGRFAFAQVRSGLYQINSGSSGVACRVWTATAAPPAAHGELVLAAQAPVVRGQQPFGAIFTNPLVIGLIVAAAIAIPLAIHNANDKPAGS